MTSVVPELKGFDCTDHHPIEQWIPDSEDVYYYLTLHIGEPYIAGADLYSALVCTPSGLNIAKQDGNRIGPQPPIILSEYSWEAVLKEVGSRLESCSGYNWIHVQDQLRLQFRWEYEGYR